MSGLEEVVVTAQRREQALQEVPITLQVIGNDLLNDVAAEDMGDLNGYVPGLVVSSNSPTQPKYQIRGIQTGDFGVGTDSAVGVYVDGIYSARSGSSLLAFNDVERIEVLKGPQGTLFGRNSAAGAVSIITRQPTDEFDASVRVRAEDYNKQHVDGMVNVPLTDDLAVRVNAVWNQSDGWIKDAATGKDLWPEDNWATRVALRWELGDKTTATLSWDHDELDQFARPAIGIVPLAAGAVGAVPGSSRELPRSAQGAGVSTTPSIMRSRASSTAQRCLSTAFALGRLPLLDRVAPVRDGQPRGRGRHEHARAVLRHRERRGQRQLLPGVQVLRPDGRVRLGRRRELLLRRRQAGERHARVHGRHRHALLNLGLGAPTPDGAVRCHERRPAGQWHPAVAAAACRGAKR